jgi:hypothetical protein
MRERARAKGLWPLAAAALFFILVAPPALAHQPRVVGDASTTPVPEPAISQAYYGELMGAPQIFRIESIDTFPLAVSVSAPAAANPDGRFTVGIYRVSDYQVREPLDLLDEDAPAWEPFFEPFAGDWYRAGGAFARLVPPGTYEIEVSNRMNEGKYVLAVGKEESFPPAELARTVQLMPQLKRDFFGVSPATFALSAIGGLYLLLLLAAGALAGFAWRALARRFARRAAGRRARNIGWKDRAARFAIGAALIGWSIATTWNPVLIAAGGFALYEGFAQWCGFYAALGRNTCAVQ